MEENKKLVEFENYCKDCVNWEKSPTSEPCDDCLSIPARDNSHKPEHFVKKEEKKS